MGMLHSQSQPSGLLSSSFSVSINSDMYNFFPNILPSSVGFYIPDIETW